MESLNIIDIRKILYPEKYESNYVYTYKSFNDELEELIGRSGYVKKFKIKYFSGLRFLENLKKQCFMASKIFEKLVSAEEIYSMTLHGEKNIRILFMFEEIEQKEIAILLNCFQEKATKDYAEEIKRANERRQELLDN